MSASPREIQICNTLRIIALTTTDELTKAVAFSILCESEDQVKNELAKTCWADDLGSLRESLASQYLNETDNRTEIDAIGKVIAANANAKIF